MYLKAKNRSPATDLPLSEDSTFLCLFNVKKKKKIDMHFFKICMNQDSDRGNNTVSR